MYGSIIMGRLAKGLPRPAPNVIAIAGLLICSGLGSWCRSPGDENWRSHREHTNCS